MLALVLKNVNKSYHAKVGMMLKNQYCPLPHQGFTLIELIVVIILISVLSVSAYSRFSGTSGFSEYTYQARLISALRNMQTRAMHDNRDGYCFQINFTSTSSTSNAAFGPPTLSYTSGSALDTCATTIDFTNPQYLTTTASEMSDAGVNLSTQGDSTASFSFLAFDNMGRPSTDSASCTSSCKIIFSDEATVNVCVESEGYIHAC